MSVPRKQSKTKQKNLFHFQNEKEKNLSYSDWLHLENTIEIPESGIFCVAQLENSISFSIEPRLLPQIWPVPLWRANLTSVKIEQSIRRVVLGGGVANFAQTQEDFVI